MKFLLTKRVPNLDLCPIRSALDIVRWHRDDLADSGIRLVFVEFIENAACRQGGLADGAVANQDELVIKLTTVE